MARLRTYSLSLMMALGMASGWTAPAWAEDAAALVQGIVLVDICSARQDHMSGFGYARPTTPNLDAFMQDATVFERAWAQSTWCLPSFTTLLTGTRPEVHRQLNSGDAMPAPVDALETLAGVLKQAGFATAGFSASRFLRDNYSFLHRGFDVFVNQPDPAQPAEEALPFERRLPAIQEWIRAHRGQRFFLYVTIDDLHAPYYADDPKRFDPTYAGVLDHVAPGVKLGRLYNGESVPDPDPTLVAAVEEFRRDERHLRHLAARYDASLNYVDRMAGALFDELKQQGMWDTSLIVVTADHGEQLGEHGLIGHTQGLYEPLLSVPVMVKHPIAARGQRMTQLVERIDIPATALEAAGVAQADHPQFTGDSLMPLLAGQPVSWKTHIFASSKPTRLGGTDPTDARVEERAVRDARYKLTWYGYKPQPYELYDLEQDPGELRNLVTEQPEMVQALKSQLDAYASRFSPPDVSVNAPPSAATVSAPGGLPVGAAAAPVAQH